jgi:hypothetical protein
MQAWSAVGAAAALLSVIGPATAQSVFTFEGVEHGRSMMGPIGPLTIKSLTPGGRLDAFDTKQRQTDVRWLEGPDDAPLPDRTWLYGNSPRLLPAGVVVRAASSPTGSVDALLSFESPMAAVTFDLLNVPDSASVVLTMIDSGGRSAQVPLDEVHDPESPAFQAGVSFGHGSHNRLGPIDPTALALKDVQRLRIRLPINAAIDRVAFHRSMPSATLLDFATLIEQGLGGAGVFDAATGGGGAGGVSLALFGGGGAGSGSPTTQDPPGSDGPSPPKDPLDDLPPADPKQPPSREGVPVPTPSAAIAGMALLASLTLRRRRGLA